jgi:hypothetical protein
MSYVLIQHQVNRYPDFESVFLDDGERRKRMGSKGGRVFRNSDDPSNIIVLLEWDDAAKAKVFAEGLELHEAMQWATSGTTSKVTVVEDILDVES